MSYTGVSSLVHSSTVIRGWEHVCIVGQFEAAGLGPSRLDYYRARMDWGGVFGRRTLNGCTTYRQEADSDWLPELRAMGFLLHLWISVLRLTLRAVTSRGDGAGGPAPSRSGGHSQE